MIRYHRELVQGSDEWLAARCGLLTASEMKLILTPTLKIADNDKTRAHVWELLAQRITQYVEPSYVGDDMLRGKEDEIVARQLYAQHYAPVEEVGFVTRTFSTSAATFTIGYSPDALVGEDGLLECKSRRQKYQVETIATDAIPQEYWLQIQTGLWVTQRKWLDFVSYSGGLPMLVLRAYPDEQTIEAIIQAAEALEERIATMRARYEGAVSTRRLIPTERRIEQEMMI